MRKSQHQIVEKTSENLMDASFAPHVLPQEQANNPSTVELPSCGIPKNRHYQKKTFSLWMLIFSAVLVQSTYAMHGKYSDKMLRMQQADTLASEGAQNKVLASQHVDSLTPQSEETRVLQQQIVQMKALMENRRKLREMEMEVLRYELSARSPVAKNAENSLAEGGLARAEMQENAAIDESYVDQDIDFARDLARDAVRQEVEGFLDRVDLISKVGSYVTKRVSGNK